MPNSWIYAGDQELNVEHSVKQNISLEYAPAITEEVTYVVNILGITVIKIYFVCKPLRDIADPYDYLLGSPIF
jgi:hypothetical protein